MSEETQVDQGLQQELNNLDQKIDGGQQEEQSEATTGDTNLVEQDGDLLLSVDTDGEEPTQDAPDNGQASDQDNLSNSEEQNEETSYQEHDAYQGKSREDLAEMLSNAQSKIGQQGSELGELRKTVESQAEEMTGEEAFDKLSALEIRNILEEQKKGLSEIDPYDDEALNKQRSLISELEMDFIAKTTTEGINQRYNQVDNESFIDNQKKAFEKQGVDLDSEEFSDIISRSYDYSQNGKLTDSSISKAMIDIYGVDQMQKHYSMVGEAKARQEIKNAGAKTTERVDVRGSGKSAKLVNINNLSGRELSKALDNLSIDDLKRLNSKYNNN